MLLVFLSIGFIMLQMLNQTKWDATMLIMVYTRQIDSIKIHAFFDVTLAIMYFPLLSADAGTAGKLTKNGHLGRWRPETGSHMRYPLQIPQFAHLLVVHLPSVIVLRGF